jgi:hypothetical protein
VGRRAEWCQGSFPKELLLLRLWEFSIWGICELSSLELGSYGGPRSNGILLGMDLDTCASKDTDTVIAVDIEKGFAVERFWG